jgi:hypothetical protein
MLKFVHEFEEYPPLSTRTQDISLPEGAIVGVRVDEKAVLLYANSTGFLHLARLFAEIGTRDLEDEFHFHVGPDFENMGGGPGEVELTVMRLNRRLPGDEKMVAL